MKAQRMTPLTDAERETVIVFSDADKGVAHVYTSHPPLIRIMRKHPRARLLEERRLEGGELTDVEFELPFACFAILARPRASTWERILRAGPRARPSRRRPLVSVRDGQNDASRVGPGGGGPR